jgi:Rod binding domain-containing protein
MSIDINFQSNDLMRQLDTRHMTEQLRSVQQDGITTGDEVTDRKLMGLSLEFEKIMLEQLMKSMRSTVQSEGLFGENLGSKTYREMFDTEIVNQSTGRLSLGLAETIYRQLIQTKGDASQAMHIMG